MRRFYIYLVFIIFSTIKVCESKYAFVTWTNETGHEVKVNVTDYYADIPDLYIAKATYKNEINSTGWAYLELHTSADVSDEKQAYGAGFLEGYLTRDLIWMNWQNMLQGFCYNKTDVCGMIEEYVDINEGYIANMIQKYPKDPYWYQMKLYYIQLQGLAMGYNDATRDAYEWLTVRDILWMNMLGDLDELAFALSMPKDTPDGILFGQHCTGLVKLLPDWSDLYTAHTSWNGYHSMLRIQKMYVMNLKTAPGSKEMIPGRKMSMSSYPAFVHSLDDFYIISSGLVTSETTISNSNRTLFENVKPIGQILEFARAMVANRLARDGQEWIEIFRKHNSGTYNNQWFVVDYNKFTPSTAYKKGVVQPGLLWVIEQLPGYTEAADLTQELVRETYFPSYNIAYFPYVFNLSGGNERVATFGNWFGYRTNPRAGIIRQRQESITDLKSMFETMRYNDFKHDPLARCADCSPPYSACNAIAARNDLNPPNGSYPFATLGHRNHGALDAKVTSSYLRLSYQFVGVSGPPYNLSRGLPPFVWSEFDLGTHVSHIGHPDAWTFQPVVHSWEWS